MLCFSGFELYSHWVPLSSHNVHKQFMLVWALVCELLFLSQLTTTSIYTENLPKDSKRRKYKQQKCDFVNVLVITNSFFLDYS